MFVFKHHLGVYLIVLMIITFFTWWGYSSDDPEVQEILGELTIWDIN